MPLAPPSCQDRATTSRSRIWPISSWNLKTLGKPTPELMREADYVISYLSRTASLGLTYTAEHTGLSGYADASWETKHSTSGWVILWQS